MTFNQEQITKAVEDGCRRSQSTLKEINFKDDGITIGIIGDNTRGVQYGAESYDHIGMFGLNNLSLRVARFAIHYGYGKSYHTEKVFGSINQ